MQLTPASAPARRGRQRGNTIIEYMLGLALAGGLVASAMVFTMRGDDQNTGRVKADQILSFQQMASQYFIANRAEIEAAMGGDAAKQALHCLINVAADGTGGTVTANTAKHTCAFDATLLRAKGGWPAGMDVDGYGGRYVGIVRQLMSADAVPVPTGGSDMLVVFAPVGAGGVKTSGTVSFNGDARRASEELKAGMDAMGATGGYIPPGADFATCKYNATVKQVCGKTWTVSLSDFID